MTYSLDEKDPDLIAKHYRLANDLPYFARHCLKILDSSGALVPFIFTPEQVHTHNLLEKQLRELGRIRATILKARQLGISTYIAARFLHKAMFNAGQSVYILSHEADSTEELFEKVQVMYEYMPEQIRRKAERFTQRDLAMDNKSDYTVATAGASNPGRGQTNQFFHGSEVAFYQNPESIKTGALQTVHEIPGTEIILESTANGPAGFFYNTVQSAIKAEGPYMNIFLPWHHHAAYTSDAPINDVTEEEKLLQDIYGLTNGQLSWRRAKIQLLGESLFKQEFPMTAEEAFQMSGDSLIDSLKLQAAGSAQIKSEDYRSFPIIRGVDPAYSVDRIGDVTRQGRRVLKAKGIRNMSAMELAGDIVASLRDKEVDHVFIDYASGVGVYDRVCELGYGKRITYVQFGSMPEDQVMYANKRAEMYGRARNWIHDQPASLEGHPALIAELAAMPPMARMSSGKFKMPLKEDIKKDLGFSPDLTDGFVLTFAYDVANTRAEATPVGNITTIKSKKRSTERMRKKAYKR